MLWGYHQQTLFVTAQDLFRKDSYLHHQLHHHLPHLLPHRQVTFYNQLLLHLGHVCYQTQHYYILHILVNVIKDQ